MFPSSLQSFWQKLTMTQKDHKHTLRALGKLFCSFYASVVYARPKVTKSQVYQFFMSTKNLHIKSFTLIPSRLYFYVKVKIYTSIISCQFFLTKVHICWSSFLLWYRVSYICMDFPSQLRQEGLVMTRLKELGQSGNYVLWNSTWPRLWISSQREGSFWNYFVFVQPKQRMFGITNWRSSGVPIEKIRTIWLCALCINA